MDVYMIQTVGFDGIHQMNPVTIQVNVEQVITSTDGLNIIAFAEKVSLDVFKSEFDNYNLGYINER